MQITLVARDVVSWDIEWRSCSPGTWPEEIQGHWSAMASIYVCGVSGSWTKRRSSFLLGKTEGMVNERSDSISVTVQFGLSEFPITFLSLRIQYFCQKQGRATRNSGWLSYSLTTTLEPRGSEFHSWCTYEMKADTGVKVQHIEGIKGSVAFIMRKELCNSSVMDHAWKFLYVISDLGVIASFILNIVGLCWIDNKTTMFNRRIKAQDDVCSAKS